MNWIGTLQNAIEVCDKVSNAINKRHKGISNCTSFCPGTNEVNKIITQLIIDIKDIEPECSSRLSKEIQNLKMLNQCVNPYSFGAIIAIVGILRDKYIDENSSKKKFFISHSSKDKIIVNGFIKEILKLGCGFKDTDIFCTLDSTSIRTGDDFREQIVKNMRQCYYILLFISDSYNISDVCKNEIGAAWALEGKRILPFVFPKVSFNQMGFFNVVKQGAMLNDKSKLDEFYTEVCETYKIVPDWMNFNKVKEDFINIISEN